MNPFLYYADIFGSIRSIKAIFANNYANKPAYRPVI